MAIIRSQQAMIETLRASVEALQQKVTALEARLRRDSDNSSKPPSTDPPWKPPAGGGAGKRRRGGQPGHKKRERLLVAVPDETISLRPERCACCAQPLSGEDPAPFCHQVTEVPQVKAHVTEYRFHTLRCARCDLTTSAPWPPDVPRGAFGPRMQAIIAVCSGAYRLSKRTIEELARAFFGVPLSLGSVSNLEHATSTALAGVVDEAKAHVRAAPVVHVDETGWFVSAKRAWLWVATTAQVAVFAVRSGRGAKVAQELLGASFAGIAVTDQWRGYDWLDVTRRQLCGAHLIRHFRGLADHGPLAQAFSARLMSLTERVFSHWHNVRDATSRTEFIVAMVPLQAECAALLREGLRVSNDRVKTMCKELLREEQALWTFVTNEGVEPTNNAAERAVRPAVLWRKGSFGTDSERGSRFVERIQTVVHTLRLQKRNVLEFVTAACEAAIYRKPQPSLLPQ